ncbi:MAG: hypothetical protein AAF488_00170 [Planctomycetota bacterium]
MPQLEQLWVENHDRGLHIFHIESQGASEEQVREFCEERGVTFPQTLRSGSDFSALPGGSGLPYAYVIGVDGKVLWQGRNGYKNVIHQELQKVRYPGLGRSDVSKPAHKAAVEFVKKKYAKAIALANKLVDDEDAAVAADAKHIIARSEQKGESLLARAERQAKNRDYLDAKLTYTLVKKGFKGLAPAETAETKLDEIKKDKSIQREIKAAATLAGLEQSLARKNGDTRRATFTAFAKKFEGTKAAEKAEKLAARAR